MCYLRDAIRRKHPGQLARWVLLHHDNARPHTVRATQERIQELQWELFEHPPYSPDLVSSDFYLFGPLKKHLGG
jgi:histone-lysine N-methyltransferase SETMAR